MAKNKKFSGKKKLLFHLFYFTDETSSDNLANIEDLKHIEIVAGVCSTESGSEHTQMFVGTKFEDEVTSQLGPGSGDKVWSVEMKIRLSSNQNHVETLDQMDGVHFTIIDISSDSKVILIDISQFKNTIITTRVYQTTINCCACDLTQEH